MPSKPPSRPRIRDSEDKLYQACLDACIEGIAKIAVDRQIVGAYRFLHLFMRLARLIFPSSSHFEQQYQYRARKKRQLPSWASICSSCIVSLIATSLARAQRSRSTNKFTTTITSSSKHGSPEIYGRTADSVTRLVFWRRTKQSRCSACSECWEFEAQEERRQDRRGCGAHVYHRIAAGSSQIFIAIIPGSRISQGYAQGD